LKRSLRSVLSLALTLVALAEGCGGAMPSARAPATIEDAQADLERAEADLGRVLAPTPGPGATGSAAPFGAPAAAQPVAPAAPPPPPPSVASEAPKPTAPAQASAPDRAAEATAASPCDVACRALDSMERAADHLCALAGSADDRCSGARARVESAEARVRAACPACAE
jgi:hypothetical protein